MNYKGTLLKIYIPIHNQSKIDSPSIPQTITEFDRFWGPTNSDSVICLLATLLCHFHIVHPKLNVEEWFGQMELEWIT